MRRARASRARPPRRASPSGAACCAEPVLTGPATGRACSARSTELGAEELLDEVEAAKVRGRGGAGFPAGDQVALHRAAPGRAEVHRRQRRRGRPRLLHRQVPDGAATRRWCSRGWRSPGSPSAPATASCSPARSTRCSKPALDAAAAQARAAGWLGDDILGSGFDFDVTDRRGRGLLRRRRGDGAAGVPRRACAARSRRGRRSRPSAACTACRRSSTTSRRSRNMPFIAAHGAEAYAALSPDARPTAPSSSASTSGSCDPSVYEVRFGMPMRELCEDVAGGLRDGRTIKALQIGGPLGGILPASKLDTAFDFDALAAEGCMVGHGCDRRVRRPDRHARRSPRHLLRFGAHESCGKCFPCRIGLRRAHEMFAADAPVDRARLRAAAGGARARQSCAPTAAACPAPIAQPARPLPRRAGALHDAASPSTATQLEVADGHDDPRGGPSRPARGVPTLCFDDRQAPVRRLPRLPGGRRGRARAAAGLHDAVPRRDGDRHHGRDRAPGRDRGRRAGALRAAGGARAPHRAGAGRRPPRRSLAEAPRWPGATHAADHDVRHPYLAFQHELCISCGRCVRACDEVQGAFALTATGRGFSANITAGLDSRVPRLQLRLVRRLRRHLPDRRDHRDHGSTARASPLNDLTAREAALLRRAQRGDEQ